MSNVEECWQRLLDAGDCDALEQEAKRRTSAPEIDQKPNRGRGATACPPFAQPFSGGVATCTVAHPHSAQRRLAVFCCHTPQVGGEGGSELMGEPVILYFVMDALCFHGKANLCDGSVMETITPIEDLGQPTSSLAARLCIQCPGHGYLFALQSGDNVVTAPKFVDGRMHLGNPKAVHHMQRVYACHRHDGGLWVDTTGTGRYASDRN